MGNQGGEIARLREISRRLRGSRRLRPNNWTPEEVERRIVEEYVEWAYVFDATGHQVMRKRGTEDGVSFTADEVLVLKDALLVHNHPPNRRFDDGDPRTEGGSFSDHDLDLVLTYDIAEIRAVTPGWRYVIVRPLRGWIPDADSAAAVYGELLESVRSEDLEAIATGRMASLEYATATQAHRVMERLAVWGRFSYRREEF